jgi:hypothetical protein
MNQINQSRSLANLKQAIDSLHHKLNDKDFERLENEKKTIDDRVDN